MTTTEDLLTENRFWTFWTPDWSRRINVYWEGKTSFKSVKEAMARELGKDFIYERQIELREPDFKFN